MGRFALAIMLAALSACSASSTEQANATNADRAHTAAASNAPNAAPATAEQPATGPGVALLDGAYCTKHGDDADSGGFGNAKECYMFACSLGDGPACDMAKTYNVNLWPDGVPPGTDGKRGSQPPTERERPDYAAARRVILDSGWQPLGGPCEGFVEDEICRDFPEIGYCQGTGRAFCDMHFERSGHCLVVITAGGRPEGREPGDTFVEDAVISKGPCKKDPNAE
jgi:hypothetical protein